MEIRENIFKNRMNINSQVTMILKSEKEAFDSQCKALENNGFIKKEECIKDFHCYAAFKKGTEGVFINYYKNTKELSIVEETDCNYFSYTDKRGKETATAEITQLHLEDFGMSYTVRLKDGRFIIIDGGWDFEPDCDRLFESLKKGSVYEKPVIAAWIMTHPHCDHFHCFIPFFDKYSDEVKIEKFMYNFPEHDDFNHYPSLKNQDWRVGDCSAYTNIPKMKERIEKSGAVTYTPHTGQTYKIGDAVCEILSGMEDTIHCSKSENAASLVIRMELEGQIILWTADTSFSIAKIPQRYKDYLKSDILQIPHHGFQCGSGEAEIEGYEYIKPKVCFLPVSDYNAYTMICTYKTGVNHIMQNMDVEELITGDANRTITLPYTPPGYAEKELKRKYIAGRKNCGTDTWIYTDLRTSEEEDFQFTVLNTTSVPANLSIDIFFEDSSKNIRYIKAQIPSGNMKSICIKDENDVDGDAFYFNWMSLKNKGIPENSAFSVRFISDIPVVISHKTHRESYRS